MRIEIKPSAQRHEITGDEVRAVIEYPRLRVQLAPRRPGSVPFLYIGEAVANEPWIEVIADEIDPTMYDVFHAMMLRPALVASLGITHHLTNPKYGPQRA